MKVPRILFTAGASGSGKTLLTCGFLQVLVNRGIRAASFKCGPDYIDPMFHSRVIGTKSRNLDTFFTSKEVTRYLLAKNAADCDIAVMEGVMGFYDGVGGITTQASAYDLADTTDTPVIFIVNSKGMSLSLLPYIKGFLEYKENSHIKGVIFNQMSAMLYLRMKKMVEEELGIKVLGYVPKVEDCIIESRHLGLVLPGEIPELKERLRKLSHILEDTLDIEGILSLAKEAPELKVSGNTHTEIVNQKNTRTEKQPLCIGLADDEAFCFFYEDNLRLLEHMGAKLIRFSPIHDSVFPENLDGLLLYGGYPELNAKALEENHSMRSQIAQAIKDGMPCMAECGGFMYLHEEMEGMDGKTYQMTGSISGKVFRTPRLSRFGYIHLKQKREVFGEQDFGLIPAHEFHYFDSENCGDAFHAEKPSGKQNWNCIHGNARMLAGFPHLYYYGNPNIPRAFLKKCREYRNEREQKEK